MTPSTEYENPDWLTGCNYPELVEDLRGTWKQKQKKKKSKHKRAHLTPLPPPLDILTHLTLTPDCVIRLLIGPMRRKLVTISSVVRTEQWFSAYHQYLPR